MGDVRFNGEDELEVDCKYLNHPKTHYLDVHKTLVNDATFVICIDLGVFGTARLAS